MVDSVRQCPSVQVTLRGFDAHEKSPTNHGTSTLFDLTATQNPTHASELDPLFAFVASLAAGQRDRLIQMLTRCTSAYQNPPDAINQLT